MSRDDPGILTEKQREWLTATDDEKSEYSRQKRYRRRKAIRKRVTNAMADLYLLYRHLPQDELNEIFELEPEAVDDEDGDEELPRPGIGPATSAAYIPSAIAFFARAQDLDDDPIFPDIGARQPALADFIGSVESGLTSFLGRQKQVAADVSVSVELNNVEPVDDLIEKAQTDATSLPPVWELSGIFAGDLSEQERKILEEGLEKRAEELDKYSSGVLDLPPDSLIEEDDS